MRLSELYSSVQCEGPNVGRMVQFVRFAGCNMRCPLWPCDTQHAIDPAIWRHEADHVTATELYARINREPWDLCLTGGEPFMQKSIELQEFTQLARQDRQIEVFTNGSFPFPRWALNAMQFIMDWKLEGSGEANTARDIRMENAGKLSRRDNIKFVIASWDDFMEAKEVWQQLNLLGVEAQFWAGAAFDKVDPTQVIEWVMANHLPWKINVQVHKYLWKPDERGV
jgi:7-carboxy-7-deazaguanine synthase